MDTSGSVHLLFQSTQRERPLLPDNDIEVVAHGLQTRVALSPGWGSEDNQAFGDACMDDIQRTHRPAGIVEKPLIVARVEDDALLRGRMFGSEVRGDVRDDRSSVVAVMVNRSTGKSVQFRWFEDIPPMLGLIPI